MGKKHVCYNGMDKIRKKCGVRKTKLFFEEKRIKKSLIFHEKEPIEKEENNMIIN